MGFQLFRRRTPFFARLGQAGLLFLSFLTAVAHADKIWLENGDIISGEIKRLEAGQLKLATPYAGEITVNWRHVRSIESDNPLWVSFIGEDQAAMRQLQSDGEQLTIVDENGYEREFTAAWPVAAISQEKPVLAEEWELTGRVGANIDSKSGNDNELVVALDGNLDVNDQWNKNSFTWDMEVEDDEGVKTSEWKLGYAYSRYFTENWFVRGAGERSYDSDEDLYSRSSLGGSLGYRFRETMDETIITSFGLTHLWENYDSLGKTTNIALNWNAAYRTRLTEKLEYFADSKLYYRMKTGQWLLDAEQGVRVGLTDTLSLNLTHYLDHDSEPGDDSKQTDNQVKMGVGYKW